ncbi:MAG: serine hydroxymethyltransferase [Patescibacteria group bacterium]
MDQQLFRLIRSEVKREGDTIDLIPSENIAPPELLRVLGSPLTNKYAEGYPGSRYYPGNQHIDDIEELAKKRALNAFNLLPSNWHANVQAYSGSPANQAVYFALAKPGDALMGLSLSSGGHLTHGHRVSFSGTVYRAVHYGLDVRGYINYDELEEIAKREQPRIIVSGATAYPRIIDFKRFGAIAKTVGAYHVADISHIAGLIAAGIHPSPFEHADVVTTTTHKTLRGPRGAVIFSRKQKGKSGMEKTTISESIDKAIFPGLQGGPHMNVVAGIAWTFGEVRKNHFRTYAKKVVENARVLSKALMQSGFSLVSGGTENHLMLLDLRSLNISGRAAEEKLEAAGIIANRNTIPGDEKPFNPSGVRIGTPSITARGMGKREMIEIAACIRRILIDREATAPVGREVKKIAARFPLPYAIHSW